MDLTNTILLITEIIGTVAFAVSGALVAIDRGLDAFGVIFIGCTTAVGGGIFRDLIIGRTPPAIFTNLGILLIAALSALLVFILAYIFRNKYATVRTKIDIVNNIFDAIGLSAFAVMGTECGISAGHSNNAVLCIALGTFTCIGGGILRDMMTNATPYVFRKHIYALASIAGSTLYFFASVYEAPITVSVIGSMLLVFTIRMLATAFKWSLPRVFRIKNN